MIWCHISTISEDLENGYGGLMCNRTEYVNQHQIADSQILELLPWPKTNHENSATWAERFPRASHYRTSRFEIKVHVKIYRLTNRPTLQPTRVPAEYFKQLMYMPLEAFRESKANYLLKLLPHYSSGKWGRESIKSGTLLCISCVFLHLREINQPIEISYWVIFGTESGNWKFWIKFRLFNSDQVKNTPPV